MRRLLTLCLFLLLPAVAAAQDRPNTILVLDGSGSMWGQIDGVNKIVIAREVVDVLLDDFPADQNLGLTVYGHRTRGDCTDIETVVPPGPDTLGAIRAAVNGINPRGKTPMTDAVIAAAEALRYTEEKAIVILVSDGIETCNPDPCAAARALEEAGIDFTAHVVGFDVTDPDALAQMQCIAGETGGQFLEASNAEELSEALTTVAVAPQPEPEPVATMVTFEARIGAADGELISTPVIWDVAADDGAVVEGELGNPLELELLEGSHVASAYWVEQETASDPVQFIATPDPRRIVIVFEEPLPTATVTAPATAVEGSTIEIAFDGPMGQDDYVGIGPVGAEGAERWENFVYVRDGSPATLLTPMGPGPHAITYFQNEGRVPLGGTTIELTPAAASITAPAEAVAGSTIEVGWTGPDYRDDYIGIGRADAEGADRWENFAYTRDGSPAKLLVPATPGDYVITYFVNQDRTPLAEVPITVTPVEASLTAPASAAPGSNIEVAWTGPNYRDDYIGIGLEGATGGARSESFAYTRDGSPATLTVPETPGTYVIRYFMNQDRTAIAETTLTVE